MTILRQLRVQDGKTQAEMADRLRISVSMYSRIEQGKSRPSCEIAHKLERAYDMDMHDMLQRAGV